ncbi:hypothetical protein [Abyssisolibacter fermentans]|nr:hypothetical protein [Abyssisolibacter fermentans]
MACFGSVLVDGYEFTFEGPVFSGESNTFCYKVKGKGAPNDLSNWVL